MTGLPGWLAGYRLDDDALAVLANRGLVRRAAKEVARIELDSAADTAVELRYVGTPPAQVRLLPGGPRNATCGCPVAGVCVHIVAACVWARESSPVEAAETQPPSARVADTQPPSARVADTQPPSVELVETPREDGFDKLNQPDVEAQLLALNPTAVNRAAGIAAVRKVAAGVEPTPTTISLRGGSLYISWPGSPDIVAVPDGGFAGMLVAGSHSDTAERAWRLEALVRLFAAHDRRWTWPDKVDSPDVVHPGQREAMVQARDTIEALLQAGLSRVGADGVQRLTAAAQRARLEALPLLATLLTQATGRANALAGRADDTSERQLLDALARAWTLAVALHGSAPPLPPQLVGGRGAGEAADTGVLLPLAVRWWTAPSGARGLTVTLWDTDHHRLETATTGRAAGSDPSFNRSWDAPLLWGVSAQTLAGGLFTLHGAERRDDGTLSSTTRTRATPGDRFAGTAVDLDQLAEAIQGSARAAAATGFLPPPASLRLVLPRRLRGVGEPELDEVSQELVWPLTDRGGVRHLARLPATGSEQDVIGWLLRDAKQIAAVVLDDQDRPLSVFIVEQGHLRLIAPSLTPSERAIRRGWLARRQPKDQRPRAHTGEQQRPDGPLVQLTEAVLDVCEALAATGRPALSNRQRDTLQDRAGQASSLGLSSLAAAIEPLLADRVTPSAVLRATLVATRTRALAGD
ncbi:hypothetical protein [Micropruina sp.]|uniref:hypothetical protein n=1 Tax=Micropruina sp. TaxID=2737536 RepID=UPI0039E702BE